MTFLILKTYSPTKVVEEYARGTRPISLPFTEVDTDGYYGPKFKGAVAVIPAIGAKKIWNLSSFVESSTEAEWASVGLGIRFALDKNQTLIALSNDNSGVMESLMTRRPMKQDYSLFWYSEIQKMIAETMGFKIRWVPREMNRAGKGPYYEEIYQSHFIYKRPNHDDVDWRR